MVWIVHNFTKQLSVTLLQQLAKLQEFSAGQTPHSRGWRICQPRHDDSACRRRSARPLAVSPWCRSTRSAYRGGAENARLENAGAMMRGNPSEEKTIRYQ